MEINLRSLSVPRKSKNINKIQKYKPFQDLYDAYVEDRKRKISKQKLNECVKLIKRVKEKLENVSSNHKPNCGNRFKRVSLKSKRFSNRYLSSHLYTQIIEINTKITRNSIPVRSDPIISI